MQQKKFHSVQSIICLVSAAVLLAQIFSSASPAVGKTKVPDKAVESNLRIVIDPAEQIFGTPFSITISGLMPGEQASINARSIDASRIVWESNAVFQADAKGIIDVGMQAPLSGEYTDADILGLLWSMKPQNPKGKRIAPYSHDEVNGLTVEFTVKGSEGQTATARLRRYYQMPGESLIRIPLEQDGLYGFLYHPVSGGPFPGVIILGGSSGGLYEWLAQAFASNGFAALTLAYFNYQDLPQELIEIPIEYFLKTVAWIKTQKSIKTDSLGVIGGSKGAELALLLGSICDDFRAVVAWVPSGYIWQGISQNMRLASSWSRKGKGLPYITGVLTPEDIAKYRKGEMDSVRQFYALGLEQADPLKIEQATIPVEKIKAPILLVSGIDDQTWPSAEFSDAIMQRLEKYSHAYEHKHIRCEGAGHMVFLPYFITGHNRFMNGGNARDDAHGSLISWTETMTFLHRHLDR
jgi:dienelactone hydrolase